MEKRLVIVESPAKAKTIKKYLGKGYTVLASYGHVRDLLPKQGAVDPSNDFEMKYELIAKNAKHVEAMTKAMKQADVLMLAPDPDREGEAIAWNIAHILEERKVLEGKRVVRVVFNEITKSAIQEAVDNPREIAMDLVHAQQARRALDYLVGFNLSPLLWKKVRRGLSAGRVQSPALRLIVERELDIEKFNSQEYWSVESDLLTNKQSFTAKLVEYKTDKVEQFTITNQEQADKVIADLTEKAKGKLTVSKIAKKQRKRNPAAPFITSTLQQEAARKLGFTAQRTMRIAQQLYEGIEIGTGSVGLISYMRTDSVNLAGEALEEIRDLIAKRYGKENLPDEVRLFKTKAKNAQEAHEAIRPTAAKRRPEEITEYLSAEQYKLYDLVWKRTIACQMIPATINTVAIDLECGEPGNRFRANGSTIANPGFMSVYLEGQDDSKASDNDEKLLPELNKGDVIDVSEIRGTQHFTEPPPRFSEASLIKSLEEFGIGRPSTYASIISTLQHREYVNLDKKRFYPTDVGRVVTKFLTEYFTKYVDFDFTADLENELDEVSRGEKQWVPLLRQFWEPFDSLIHKIDETVKRSDVTQEKIDEKCPECEADLSIRLGRTGRFIGCTAFPECSYTRSLDDNGEPDNAAEIIGDRKCPKDEAELIIKHGPYGKFIGCSNYPDCKFIEPLVKPRDTEVKCPKCSDGTILERKSKRGKIFFSCSGYPKCDYALWNEPLDEACPKCEWPMLTLKVTKRSGEQKVCPQQSCDYIVSKEEETEE
jgi:DNA topoisomerase-1